MISLGGILTLWAEEAERRRKIVTRESGIYDDASGVYLGDDKPAKPSVSSEDFTPGGILARIQDSRLAPSPKDQQGHRRNRSAGGIIVSHSADVNNGVYLSDRSLLNNDGKRRALSNIEVLKKEMGENWEKIGSEPSTGNNVEDVGSTHKHNSSATAVETLHVKGLFNQESNNRGSKLKPNGAFAEPNLDISHIRSNSGVSITSEGSMDFLGLPSDELRSRTSSNVSDIGPSASQQGSPSFPSFTSNYSESKTNSSTSGTSIEIKNDSKIITQNETEQDKTGDSCSTSRAIDRVIADHIQIARQRSISLTEKRRNISPTLDMIPETRSASFHGSTEFNKINANKSLSRSNSNSQDYGSTAEVKILNDKTIIFRTGVEKLRAQSLDSNNMSDLRRDRILQAHGGSQGSHDESEITALRSGGRNRGSSMEKADYARRLGLKSGDIAKGQYKRSSSASSSFSGTSPERKKIVNKNRVCGSAENVTVISGDFRKNVRANSDLTSFTTSRDAMGYVALSSLRRQRSFKRDLENKAKVNVYNPRLS